MSFVNDQHDGLVLPLVPEFGSIPSAALGIPAQCLVVDDVIVALPVDLQMFSYLRAPRLDRTFGAHDEENVGLVSIGDRQSWEGLTNPLLRKKGVAVVE
jgi:hypothetical protein